MRAARLLSIQMLLETRGRMSARALAATLEVSLRTLHRDIDHLSAAGVPVLAERGRNGGFRLMEGWHTRLTGLTAKEAQAVFLSGLSGPAAQLGLREPLRHGQLKMMAALPAAWREGARDMQARLHLDPVDWYREPDPVPQLATVAEAVWSDRKLAFRYRGWARASERTTSPLGLTLKSGVWYLVGHGEEGYRTYRVAAIENARLMPGRAKRPKGFDLAKHWRQAVERFELSIYASAADVLVTPAGVEALRQLNSASARAVSTASSKAADGRLRVHLPIESIAAATGQLLSLGPDVEVSGPAALRRAIQARLRDLARTYA